MARERATKSKQDVIPEDVRGAELWRAAAILAWLEGDDELKECSLLQGHVEDAQAVLEDDDEYKDRDHEDLPVTAHRFLVVKLVIYCPEDGEREVDQVDWAAADDLEQAKHEVEDHVFEDTRADYFNECRVFDANLRREQPFHPVKYIEWGEAPKE